MPPARARCRLRYLPPTGFPLVACPLLISFSFQISNCAEGDDEFRTAALTGLHPSAATMSLGNLPHDGEPSARSFDLAPYGPLEKVKYALRVLRRHSRTAVANGNADDFGTRIPRPIRRDLHIRRFAGAGKLQGICDEVIDRLGRPCLVHP